MLEDICRQAEQAAEELIEKAKLHPGQIVVIGCSTSEICGSRIGEGMWMIIVATQVSAANMAARIRVRSFVCFIMGFLSCFSWSNLLYCKLD